MGETVGWGQLAINSLVWMLAWLAIFYALCWSHPGFVRQWPSSSKPIENNRYWCARIWLGILHACLVSLIALPSFVVLASAPAKVQFGSSHSVASCESEAADDLHDFFCRAIALAGLAFTTFTCTDVVVCAVHRLLTVDYLVHHLAFIVAGVIIRSHCMLSYNASILLAMEASTPFLNFMLFFRHRGPRFQLRVTACGGVFFMLFILLRLILNTYGAILLWTNRETPRGVPAWQLWFVLVAVSLGAAVQFFWFPKILRIFVSKLCGSTANEEAHEDQEAGCQIEKQTVELTSLPARLVDSTQASQ